jgi:tetratricopeptide (TPR) repeat protein
VLGTPAYMAPEQARGEPADARADVFALGGILCAVLTGQPPFCGLSFSEVLGRAQAGDLSDANARLDGCGADGELVALCRRCLSPAPADRLANGQAVADALIVYLDGVQKRLHQAELAKAEANAKAAEEAKRRRLTLALAATVLLALTLGGGGWLWVKSDRDARQTQVSRDVNAALNQATELRGQAKAAVMDGPALFARAREQAQRASALAKNGLADEHLNAKVQSLLAELDQEEKDQKLLADLDASSMAQAELVAGENRFAQEQAVPLFRKALEAYGLPAGQGEPEAVAKSIQERPVHVRETLLAALDDWIDLAANPKYGIREPHLAWLEKVRVAADPQDAWTRRLLTVRQIKDRVRLREGLEKLEAQTDVSKVPALSLVRLAGALESVQADARALRLRRATQQQHSGDFWVNLNLGMALLRANPPAHAEAVRYLMAAVALRPKSPGARINLGSALIAKGEVDEAIACARKAIELDPKYVAAYHNLGSALSGKGALDEAIASYKKATALDPKYVPAHTGLGDALRVKGKVNEAIASYRQAIALNPRYATAHTNLGNTLAGKGKLDEAIACLRKTIAFEPDDARAHYNLAVVLNRKGKVDEAIACYKKAIALDPKHGSSHSNLGVVLAGRGELDEAIAYHKKAVEFLPRDAQAHTNLGNALGGKGLLDEAIDCWRKAIALDPKNVSAHGALGLALFKTGRYAEARDVSAHALALLPDEHPLRVPVSRQLRECRRFLKLEARLPPLLRGEDKATSAQEMLDLAMMCHQKKLYATAARFSAEAFAEDRKLAFNLPAQHRYHGACSAARAAAGQGEDAAKLDDMAKAKLRGQALDWLNADLALCSRLLESGPPEARPFIVRTLREWKQNPDLAGIRDQAMLGKLPEEEQKAFTLLWTRVTALLKKAEPPAKNQGKG